MDQCRSQQRDPPVCLTVRGVRWKELVAKQIAAADTGTLLTLPFDNGPAFFNGLDSGKQYIFGYEVTSINGGASNFEVFNDFTSSLLQPGFNTFLNFGHAPGWGTTGDNPVIRVNFGNLPISTSIANNQVSNVEFDVLPNPNNGEIKLNISTTSPIAYNLNIRNMLGQVVYNDIINVNGNKTERLDLSNVEKGIYFVSLENGNDKLVKKVIVK